MAPSSDLAPPTQQNRQLSTWEKKDEERVEGVENLDWKKAIPNVVI